MKKNLGKKNLMFPMPVLMIGTYGKDGTPNVMNAAWGGITLEDEITICIDTSHKTWANIAERKASIVTEYAQKEYALKRELYAARQRITDEVFAAAEEKLRA